MLEVSQEQLSLLLKNVDRLNQDFTEISINLAVLTSRFDAMEWYFRLVVGGIVILILERAWKNVMYVKNGKNNQE